MLNQYRCFLHTEGLLRDIIINLLTEMACRQNAEMSHKLLIRTSGKVTTCFESGTMGTFQTQLVTFLGSFRSVRGNVPFLQGLVYSSSKDFHNAGEVIQRTPFG